MDPLREAVTGAEDIPGAEAPPQPTEREVPPETQHTHAAVSGDIVPEGSTPPQPHPVEGRSFQRGLENPHREYIQHCIKRFMTFYNMGTRPVKEGPTDHAFRAAAQRLRREQTPEALYQMAFQHLDQGDVFTGLSIFIEVAQTPLPEGAPAQTTASGSQTLRSKEPVQTLAKKAIDLWIENFSEIREGKREFERGFLDSMRWEFHEKPKELNYLANHMIERGQFNLVKQIGIVLAKNKKNTSANNLAKKLIEHRQFDGAYELSKHLPHIPGYSESPSLQIQIALLPNLDKLSEKNREELIRNLPPGPKRRLYHNLFIQRAPLPEPNREGVFGTHPKYFDPVLIGSMKRFIDEGDKTDINLPTQRVIENLMIAFQSAHDLELNATYKKKGERADLLMDQLKEGPSDVPILFACLTKHHIIRLLLKIDESRHCTYTLYNTGEGLERYHKKDEEDPERFQTFYQYRGVPLDEVLSHADVFQQLDQLQQKSDDANQVYPLVDSLSPPDKKKEDPRVEKEFYELSQAYGTCVTSSAFALIRHQILEIADRDPSVTHAEQLMQWKLVKTQLLNHLWKNVGTVTDTVEEGVQKLVRTKIIKTGRYLHYAELAKDPVKYKKFCDAAVIELKKFPQLMPQYTAEQLAFKPKMHENMEMLRQLTDDLVHTWTLLSFSGKNIVIPNELSPPFEQYTIHCQKKMNERLREDTVNIRRRKNDPNARQRAGAYTKAFKETKLYKERLAKIMTEHGLPPSISGESSGT